MVYLTGNVGAPKGGRVHWFKLSLSEYIHRHFIIIYDNKSCNYFLHRNDMDANGCRFQIVYIVIRTSTNRYRIAFYETKTNTANLMIFKSAGQSADWIDENSKIFIVGKTK